MVDTANIGPYKATRLWNDVIFAFRQYLPCGRHRRYMKTFDNCFSGASATEWLLQYLKTTGHFGSDISREKATSLLNKLYRAGIFEEVKVSKSMRHKQDVQENRLYKFSPVSPSKMKITRLPLAPRNDIGINHPPLKMKSQHKHDLQDQKKQECKTESDVPEKKQQSKLVRKISILKRDKIPKEIEKENEESYPPCHLVNRVLTTREIKDTWKAAFLLRSKKILGVTNLSDIISPNLIDGYNVMHNCIYLNKSGIVTNIDAKDQLPHWVMSAMKCLARWPEPPEPGLPNYPGFEKDVFGVVKDYFLSQEQPLVPYNLYDVITNVFVMAGNSQPRHSSPHHCEGESSIPSTLWSSASLENIILNLTKKYCLLDSTDDRYGTNEDLSNAWFGTQDVQFAGQMNKNCASYNQSAFPSTDGMDKLGQNHIMTNQASCPSLSVHHRGPSALSRTTQSNKETSSGSAKWLSGISRKYGSAPDLKVSRYETAFGPDNKTVTRVFYQNGMTTDFGHDDVDGIHPRVRSGRKNTHRVKSTNCLYDNDDVLHRDTYLTERPVARSKSSVNVKDKRHDIVTDTDSLNKKFNTSFSGSIVRSSSFSGNRISRKQFTSSQCSLLNSSREVLCDADNKFSTAFQKAEEPNDKAVHNSLLSVDCHQSDVISSLQHSSQALEFGTAVSQAQCPCDNHNLSSYNLNSSQCQSDPRKPKTLDLSQSPYFCAREEIISSAPILKPLSIGSYGPGYRHRQSTPSEKPITSDAIKSTSSLSTHDYIQEQVYESSVLKIVPSTTRPYYPDCIPSCGSQETEYNIVLDASKKISVLGSTNLASLQHAPSRNRSHSTYKSSANRISRTYSPHCHGTSTPNDLDYIPGLSFSNITPFYSMDCQSGRKTQMSSFMSYPQTRLSEDRVKNSLQMITLLLPPANRRKLHLLFKMMVKMTSNPNLCLDSTQTTRSLVLGTFYTAIIRSPEECELDEVVQLQLVSFMLDFYDDIFTPPPDIKTHVSDRLKSLQRPQVVYSPKPERTVRFCQQTSVTDFEKQRISSSQTALEKLLEDIITDQNMDVKEKSKRLKQFQKTYPTIYAERFPSAESEAKALLQKPKMKQPLIAKPLNKLKGLRL